MMRPLYTRYIWVRVSDRLGMLQTVILIFRLKILDDEIAARQVMAETYGSAFAQGAIPKRWEKIKLAVRFFCGFFLINVSSI